MRCVIGYKSHLYFTSRFDCGLETFGKIIDNLFLAASLLCKAIRRAQEYSVASAVQSCVERDEKNLFLARRFFPYFVVNDRAFV